MRPTRSATAATSFGVSAALTFAGVVLTVVDPHPPGTATSWGFRGFAGLLTVTFAGTGLLLRLKRPESVIGRLLEVSGVVTGVQYFSGEYAAAAITRGHSWPGGEAMLWLQTWVWIPAMAIATAFLFLRFPDGRLPSPRWRHVERLAAVAITLGAAGQAIKPGPVENVAIADNPLGVHAAWATQAAGLGMFAFSLALAVGAGSLFTRRRSADPVVRLQLRWLAYAAVVVAAVLLPSGALTLSIGSHAPASKALQVLLVVSVLGLPLSICVAVARYRLYDIDRLISRTVSYAIVTSALAGLYVGVIVLATQVLPLSSSFAVAASTLVAAGAFNPLRRAVQQGVDRRFNRAKYDADRLVDDFAGHVREAVTVDTLRARLGEVVHRAVEPAHVSVWTPKPTAGDLSASPGVTAP